MSEDIRSARLVDILSERDPWVASADATPAENVTPEMLDVLREHLRTAPNETLLDAPAILGSSPTIEESLRLIEQADAALRDQAGTVALIEATVAADEPYDLPERHRFPGYDPAEIRITPNVHKFESAADWSGWAVTAAMAWHWRLNHRKPEFPRHSLAASRFVYPLDRTVDGLKVALFSDACNGYYHSRYIMKHMAMVRPAAAVHIGDVYYTGREFEVARYLEAPMKRLLQTSPCFVMNANHEMDSYGIPYFEFVRRKRVDAPQKGYVPQPQEGSYFCLEADRYQIIGLDTAFFRNAGTPILSARPGLRTGWLQGGARDGSTSFSRRMNRTTRVRSRSPICCVRIWPRSRIRSTSGSGGTSTTPPSTVPDLRRRSSVAASVMRGIPTTR